jgi:Flp pilus assembly protein TadG
MLRSIQAICLRLRDDEGGNVFILFAASMIPVLLFMGGAVDLARYARYKADLSNAVDSAALALARQGEDFTEAEATEFVGNYMSGFSVDDAYFSVGEFAVEKTDHGFVVSVDGSMDTIFLPLGKVNNINADIAAEVVHASNRVELALVLDNTGSMNCGNVQSGNCVSDWSSPSSGSRIVALQNAAHTLIDTLMQDNPEDPDLVKIAVVPFEGAVNIKNASLDYGWLDWQNTPQAKFNGANFDEIEYEVEVGEKCKGSGKKKKCEPIYETVSQEISHKWLFDQLHADNSNVEWAGCVEMRAAPYDLLDTTPSQASPDTLFVPYFWPDEPDSDNDNGDDYTNNYLDDQTSSNGSGAQRHSEKYLTSEVDWDGSPDTSFPYESGPNFGCPRPIVPLTNVKATVEAAIDNLVAYYSTGTFIPTGLVWGWHVLSSTAPFTEGLAPSHEDFDKTVKALVLLTDGDNFITSEDNHNKSRFSAYNYVNLSVGGAYRLSSNNVSTATTNLNTKTSTACTNVKSAGIRLYTIIFGNTSSATETLMRNCATVDDGAPLY